MELQSKQDKKPGHQDVRLSRAAIKVEDEAGLDGHICNPVI